MSFSFSQNPGSRLSLKVRTRWGLSPCARQIRRTPASLMPAAAAMVRVLQCVAFPGFCCSVISTHHPDHLSIRADTDSSGTRTSGHLPFGEAWYETGTSDKWKFTTYERDSGTGETGLDYAQFRYYASGQGRFMSADLISGKLDAPQSFNRYRYVANDPINLIDPHGLFIHCDSWEVVLRDSDGLGIGCVDIDDFAWDTGGHGPGDGGPGGGTGGGGGNGGTPKPKCKDLNLDNAQTFWNDQFATPDQVESYFQNQGMDWDGAAAGAAFAAAGINPGLAVGIINAETSFGNSALGLSGRNERDSFSSGGKNFANSLERGLGVVVKIENATFTDGTSLSVLENKQNDAGGYRGTKPVGQQYSGTEIQTWLNNVETGFRDFARFLGLCD